MHLDKIKDKERKDFDKSFIEHMIEHHKEGVEMAEMAREKAEHSSIKKMAEVMSHEHKQEIEDMQRLKDEI
jgi:uncharacterized protein (DUF305 family)